MKIKLNCDTIVFEMLKKIKALSSIYRTSIDPPLDECVFRSSIFTSSLPSPITSVKWISVSYKKFPKVWAKLKRQASDRRNINISSNFDVWRQADPSVAPRRATTRSHVRATHMWSEYRLADTCFLRIWGVGGQTAFRIPDIWLGTTKKTGKNAGLVSAWSACHRYTLSASCSHDG